MAATTSKHVASVGGIVGFDHGAGHPLLFLDDAKAPNRRKNNGFKDLGNYSEWPKVAGAVIKAGIVYASNHLHMTTDGYRATGTALPPGACRAEQHPASQEPRHWPKRGLVHCEHGHRRG